MIGPDFRKATASDWSAIAGLLTAAGLTLACAREHLDAFLVATRGDVLVGTAALERYGNVALLRSVAVTPAERGKGLGRELVRRLLDDARRQGIKSIVLLTVTADDYFPRFGFARITRAEVPTAVQASAEFQGACPASSTAMLLELR